MSTVCSIVVRPFFFRTFTSCGVGSFVLADTWSIQDAGYFAPNSGNSSSKTTFRFSRLSAGFSFLWLDRIGYAS